MEVEHSKRKRVQQKVVHEVREFAIIASFLAILFCVLATYRMLLQDKFHISSFAYGTALLNAVIVAKVILIGQAMHIGSKLDRKALIYSATCKAFLFGCLVLAFHFAEELARQLLHGLTVAGAVQQIRIDEALLRALIVFCTFIPLFLFLELRRVIGGNKFRALFFQPPP